MATVMLSEEEKYFIVSGIEEDFRTDGRSCNDYRAITVQTGVISNTSGSVQVKLAGTNVLIGVKAEISEPLLSKPNLGKVEFFVDCSANASPIFEGRGGDELAFELSAALQNTFSGAIDLEKLCIIPGKACWILYIDALVLECGGNLFDALSIAVKAALHNTRIPTLSIIGEGAEKSIEVSDDPYNSTPIDVSNIPVLVTLNKVGERYIVDATAEEEICSDAQLLVSINQKGNVCSVQKHGSGGINPDLLFEMLKVGRKIGRILNEQLNLVLEKQTAEYV